jgi:hypothetical protein
MSILDRLRPHNNRVPQMGQAVDDFPTNLYASLARLSPMKVPLWMPDPASDLPLLYYADILATLDWAGWEAIHERAELYRPARGTLMFDLVAALGERDAAIAAEIANRAGTAVNSLVLGHFVRSALAAESIDVRLAKTWLDCLDRHEHHGHVGGTVVAGAWGVLFRSTWAVPARQRSWEPFAYAVPFRLFGLEPDVS